MDALGNRLQSWRVSDDPNAADPTTARTLSYQNGSALVQIVAPNNDSTAGHYYKEERGYDAVGNEIGVGLAERTDINTPLSFVQRASFYDAAQRLRVMERHLGGMSQGNSNTATDFGAHEEYRYDALGRRVFVVSLGGGGSYTERTIWDGDQMLYQVRDAYPYTTTGSGGVLGTVGYIHGGGIDHPLAVWKADIGTVAPFTDWRGTYALGATATGGACCAGFLWPARAQTVDRGTAPQAGLVLWLGSVLQEGQDGSGLQYKRNRYYDPQAGRFTQVDPIGLAGGLNAYGFAGGDPVTYSDPFGLKVCFLGKGASSLAKAAMTGTGATFDLDASGCAINVQAAGGKETEVSNGFAELAGDENFLVNVQYGDGGSRTDDKGITVDKNNFGKPYGTSFVSPGVCSTSPGATWDEPSVVTHELGHAYGTFKGQSTKENNETAVRWENTVHSAQGRPLRSQQCHVK